MKNRLLALLGFILLTMPRAATAQQFGDFGYTSDGSAITITNYTGSGGAVTIPDTISGLPVTGIAGGSGHKLGAFERQTNVTIVTIPGSVTNIGSRAFFSCTSLVAISVDAANASYSSLDGVLFNRSLTAIIQYPGGKSGSYQGPGSLTTIESYAFAICTSLTGVTIPGSVTNVGNGAFSGCTGLRGVTIPVSVTFLGDSVFSGCTNLTSVTILHGVASIGNQAFASCASLASVTIPGSVTNLGSYSFAYCTSLTNITLANGVASIGYQAFDNCWALTSITIPGSVTSIGYGVFSSCFSLTCVTMLNGLASIGYQAFFYCTGLTNVVLPGSVTNIGDGAFQLCTSLTHITIPGGVTSIGATAFASCASLASVTMLSSVASIGYEAFGYCTNLTGVFFKGDAPSFGLYSADTFYGDNNATVYYLPDTTGWGATFVGRPAVLWNPLMQTSGVGPTGFGFSITGTADIPIVIEAATSLANPAWVPLQSLNLTNGAFHFSDPNWTNYPARFYRIRSP